MQCCIRGAITIEDNSKEQIYNNTRIMLEQIINENNINIENITSILFTATNDIDAAYPAVAARELGIVDSALMCLQEMHVEGSLRLCIRAMVSIEGDKTQKEAKHVYLKGATKLRPDIINKASKKIDAVAIDGPAGSGKSTIAKLIAKQIGYIYVDTGAMYRTVGLYCIKNGIDYNNEEEVLNILDDIIISIRHEDGAQRIYLKDEDVTELIRTQDVADSASKVGTIAKVREKLVSIQKDIVDNNKVVMDGRDIGTNVIPNAKYKLYLDASVEQRAKRRFDELSEKGQSAEYNKILSEIIERDYTDKNRKVNPLTIAKDAVVIDTTQLSIADVKCKILDIILG